MPLQYFFYGTLMDTAVLDTVLGRQTLSSCRRGAVIGGYRRVYRAGAWYPILVPEPDGRVDGVLVSSLTSKDAARLAEFEGTEYALAELPVEPVGGGAILANVFLAASGVPGLDREWTLQEWRWKHRKEYLRLIGTSNPRGAGWGQKRGGER